MAEKKVYPLTPEQGYALMVAALDIIGGITPGVHERLRRDVAKRGTSARPTVNPWDVVKLVDVLNEIAPGMAEQVITRTHEDRLERQREQYASRYGAAD